MRLRTLLLVSTALLLAVTCDKKKEEPEPQPQPPVTPKIEIPSESQAVFSQGISIQAGTQAQSQTVKFTATAAWSADVADTKASSWLSVQPTSGSAGAVTMTVTAQPNTTDKARSSTVTIQCGTIKQSFTVNQDAAAPQTIAVESVTLNKTELTLEPSGTETLTATVAPENATDKTVTWSTSNAEIATVADGKVTAVKEGEAIITAKAGEKQATCKVTVKKATVAVESVTLNKTELTLEPDGTETLIATIKPDNATDKTVTWSTSNAEIANVADGKVTAVKEGEAIITAKAGEKQATCKVTVKKGVVAVTSVTLNKDKLDLRKGEDETLVATVAPDDATDKTVTWSSSDATIASVDQTGKVTAVKSGKATITAAAGEKSATCEVTVTTPVQSVSLDRTTVSLEEGQTTTLTATISPNDADEQTVTWTTSNAATATVANGVVTAVAEGSAVIKASAGGKEASCTVTVQKKVIAVTEITLNKATLELKKGKSETLVATVAPDDATDKTVTWTTSNAGVATVVDGLVTAVEEGTAIIQASAGDKTARCEVAVTAYHISVSPTSLSFLSAGGSKDIKISCNGDWSISGQPSWCTPSATTGTGDATIQLTVSANNDAKRSGSLTITCSGTTKTVAITQLGGGWQNQRFVHKSLYMMFTSVFCGLSNGMDKKIAEGDGLVRDKYYRVDVHGRGLGDAMEASPLDFPKARELENIYYTATPSGILDFRMRIMDGYDDWVRNKFVESILQQESIYQAETGVSFESSLSGRSLSVHGFVYAHKAESYKITVYLIEDAVSCYSNLYDNVLRMSLTNTLGDEFTIEQDNSIYEFQLDTDISDDYNTDNLSILVIVQRQYGTQTIIRDSYFGEYYVDNCRRAKVGTSVILETMDYSSGNGNEGYEEGDEISF